MVEIVLCRNVGGERYSFVFKWLKLCYSHDGGGEVNAFSLVFFFVSFFLQRLKRSTLWFVCDYTDLLHLLGLGDCFPPVTMYVILVTSCCSFKT